MKASDPQGLDYGVIDRSPWDTNSFKDAMLRSEVPLRDPRDGSVLMVPSYGDVGPRMSGSDLNAADEELRTFQNKEVNWGRVWREVDQGGSAIPPFGAHPYWAVGGPRQLPVPSSKRVASGLM